MDLGKSAEQAMEEPRTVFGKGKIRPTECATSVQGNVWYIRMRNLG